MIERRTLVLAAAAAGTAGLAGCIDSLETADPAAADGEDDPDETGGGDAINLEDDVADGFVRGYQTQVYESDAEEVSAEMLSSADDATEYLGLDDRDGAERESLRALLDGADFEADHLFAFEAQGSNLCYRLELESVAADEDEGLTVDAAAVENRDEDEQCGEALVRLGLLVRVVYEDGAEKPNEGTVSMSGPRSGTGFSWASDSASAGESNSASGGSNGADGSTDAAGDPPS